MSNENHETIADIVTEMRKRAEEVYAGQDGYPESWKDQMDYGEIYELADRIEAAHNREIADEKRISDAVIQYLRDKKLEMAGEIAEKEAEVSTLRALVKEMADELSKFHAWKEACALVAKASEVVDTISQPHRGARRNAETTEAIDPTHVDVRKG